MKDETIRAGDLVMVVRNHCSDLYCGTIHTVRGIDVTSHPLDVAQCGSCGRGTGHNAIAVLWDGGQGIPLPYLKKIPPLSEPSHTDRREEIEA
jgi:hypothetical protein